MSDPGAFAGVSRRMLMAGVAGAVLTPLPRSASVAGDTDLDARPMRLLIKLMASLKESSVPWFYTGRIYAMRPGLAPVHLVNFEGSEIYWIKPTGADSWSLAVSTLTFYRDRSSGAYLDRFENPLTGKSVDVSPNVLRSKPGQGAVYAADSLSMLGETQPVVTEIHRSGGVLWLTTGRGTGHGPQPSMEVNTLFAAAADMDNARLPNAPATFSSVSLSRWSKWLEMGEMEGNLVWHAAGRKLKSIDELPDSYRRRAAALNSNHFTNPELAPLVPAAAPPPPDATEAPVDLRFSYVTGGGGVPLSVVQAGAAGAPGILFIHGLGQSHLSFERQLHSALAQHYHLVAFDLRGHGNSGKPWDSQAYASSTAWADDVAQVIEATGLERPLVVAWSYGTLVIADYIRQRGARGLSGIVMIGALGGLAALPPSAFDPKIMAKMQELRQLTASPGLENTLLASHGVVPLLTARPMPPAWTARCETIGAMVPPFARGAMGARMSVNNADLIDRIQLPMLLLAGSEDKGTPLSLMHTLSEALPDRAQVDVYEGSGHSPFAEEPDRFNRDLAAFADAARKTKADERQT